MKDSTHHPQPVYIHACGSHSALGLTHDDIHHSLISGIGKGMSGAPFTLSNGLTVNVGRVTDALPDIADSFSHQQTRNNRLALSALLQISDAVEQAKATYGADRVAVIVGSSTSGIADGEDALKSYQAEGELPSEYSYYQQQLNNLSDFIADYFDVTGPAYVVSTACSSSGRVFLSAKRLLRSGLADAVIVGGADTLCNLTLNGFFGLDSVSSGLCKPFSDERDGINIGEAAAFMLLSLERPDAPEAIALLGSGDSSDAHHISAPHPEGLGAEVAMRNALADAGLTAADIAYVNAHGTSTPLNDAMESKAIFRVLGDNVPVSSTKPLTGHTLGAASAIEAAICWHLLSHGLPLPVSIHQQSRDPEIAPIRLATRGESLKGHAILSNSFAFGGNNVSLILGKL
ncbi:beta-ketoacyl-[acyl-carrier-protein] synthase family protein [Enterovibrio paralichthyis]|uniref:beta-ketoacyl-[acyl-carrier-protein] synthase family protein n=1 Tax=Enterovibrio paralichthyis TaxID=2853805 RepID=UPI001C43DD33|nr:beta-ketoacyl-[acyl-carrier-protein] synthase family protein [Enterovibrio paralichthyis]MBV7297788.1 beta-ketoacyl-[acyl-carrier-protein] synthase family protein [Enterovibrio paralichthyis]